MSRPRRLAPLFELCCILWTGSALAEDIPITPWTGVAQRLQDFPAFSAFAVQPEAGRTGLPSNLELATLHRPMGGIDLLAQTTEAGSMAGVVVASGVASADVATISILSLSSAGGENATTVHAVTQTAAGPLLAAATTRWNSTSDGGGTSAYAAVAGPEGAVFRATGDLSQMTLRPWVASYRRERMHKPTYGWDVADSGRSSISFFLCSLNGVVSESSESGVGIDLAETVSGARLPEVSIAQIQNLDARSYGVQAGLGFDHELDGGLSLWTRIGVGLSVMRAETRLLHLTTIDQIAASGVTNVATVKQVVPSLVMTIGLSQSFGDMRAVSIYIAAEAAHTPALAFSGEGPAMIRIDARSGMALGLNMTWRF